MDININNFGEKINTLTEEEQNTLFLSLLNRKLNYSDLKIYTKFFNECCCDDDRKMYLYEMLKDKDFDFYYDYEFCNCFDLGIQHIIKKYNIDYEKLCAEAKSAVENNRVEEFLNRNC